MVLPLYMEEQETNMWCWAATSVSLARFYNPLYANKQCEFVKDVLKKKGSVNVPPISVPANVDCCKEETKTKKPPQGCYTAFNLTDALEVAGKLLHETKVFGTNPGDPGKSSLDSELDRIKKELKKRRPVAVVVLWGGS